MKPSASKLSLYTRIMSKATFPNTKRRRLASSVGCRLSSSGAAFFFARLFFHDSSLHSDKRPPKQGPYSCCSRPMIGLRGLWLGALRGPWPVQPMKTRGLWPMTTLRGLWPGAVTPRGLWPMNPLPLRNAIPVPDRPLSPRFPAPRPKIRSLGDRRICGGTDGFSGVGKGFRTAILPSTSRCIYGRRV